MQRPAVGRSTTAAPAAAPCAPRSCSGRSTARARRRMACSCLAAAATASCREATAVASTNAPQRLLAAMLDCHLADQQRQHSRSSSSTPAASASSSSSDAASTAYQHRSACSTEVLLDAIYESLDEQLFFSKGGFVIPPREKRRIDSTGGSASYGEVQAAGVDALLRCFALGPDSVFVDLGCGRGRAVLQVALHSTVAKAVGLELSESRLEQAELAAGLLQRQGLALAPVEFRQEDLSSCSFDEGSHFYLCSTAFGASICRSIAERLHAAPNFRALITSRQLPSQPYLYKAAELPCQFSFNADGRAYVYVRSVAAAPAALLGRLWCAGGACWLPAQALQQQQLGLAVDEPLDAAPRPFVTLSQPALVQQGAPAGSDGGGEQQAGA